MHRPKRWEYDKDHDNSLDILSDKKKLITWVSFLKIFTKSPLCARCFAWRWEEYFATFPLDRFNEYPSTKDRYYTDAG